MQASAYKFFKKRDSGTGISCEFCEISKNTFFYRTPPPAASIDKRQNSLSSWYPIPLDLTSILKSPRKIVLRKTTFLEKNHLKESVKVFAVCCAVNGKRK